MRKSLLTLIPIAIFLYIGAISLSIVFATGIQAHSGRTDSSGGHNCNVGSCAGTYHYHNGGSSNTAPSTPNYVEQGMTNGKAHAEREADNIRTRTKTSGYQTGYSEGISGTARSYYAPHPDVICDINFTFDTGTNETYKIWYKSGWTNECNTIAKEVYQISYDDGFVAGEIAKPKLTTTSTAPDEDNSSSIDEWLGWIVLGGFVGLPVAGAALSGIKEWWNS